jgi:hypothetical protein
MILINQSNVPEQNNRIIASDGVQNVVSTMTQMAPLPPSRTFGAKSTGYMTKKGTALDVTRNAPQFNDPRYTSSTLAIPTDERTLHGLYRFFAETDPIVGSALQLHTELPLAGLSLGQCEDSAIQSHYTEMWERINGNKMLNDITAEYTEIGNTFSFGAFNEADYMWDQFTILNPDYVKVESTWVNQRPLVKLVPDEALKRLVQTRSPRALYDQLPPSIIRYVLFNQEIPLDPNNIFHIARAKRPYEQKGRSLIKRILKTLMLEDRFNQANFALATKHAVPLQVVKVGNDQWMPLPEELDQVRDMIAAYEIDPSFCYDDQTEVLTNNGFKKYVDVLDTDLIGQVNPNVNWAYADPVEFVVPEAKFEKEYDGEMYHFNTVDIDVMVTPNHRVWYLPKNAHDFIVGRADEVPLDVRFLSTAKWLYYDSAFSDLESQTELQEELRIRILQKDLPVLDTQYAIEKEHYVGKVWCFQVPTGLFVTRRNGVITVQGNSIVWHSAIDIEYYGSNGKMLPVGPELDRMYRLKFIGMEINEQLISGAGGSYAQAYVSMEVQRQRYLNLQLKLESFVHTGIFKPVADLCGFYRVKQAFSGYAGTQSHKYGAEDGSQRTANAQYTSVRDLQDNKDFRKFLAHRAAEEQQVKQMREYVYPDLDWGALSASSDENLKNYIKWLVDKKPYLVDDATLARLGKLDRDTQEKAYMADLERKQARLIEISKKGLLPFVETKPGGAGGGAADFGGIGDISVGGGAGGDMPPGGGPASTGGDPNMPVGAGGPPDAAGGQTPPAGMAGFKSLFEKVGHELSQDVLRDDAAMLAENRVLQARKKNEHLALLKAVG